MLKVETINKERNGDEGGKGMGMRGKSQIKRV